MSPEGRPQPSSGGRVSESVSPQLRMAAGGSELRSLDRHIKKSTAEDAENISMHSSFLVSSGGGQVISVSFSRNGISFPPDKS